MPEPVVSALSPGVVGLGALRSAYACPCDESVMYETLLYPMRAKGMWVWVEDDGDPYLDLVLGYSSNNFGHCHPQIVEAAQEACARLTQVHSFHTRAKLLLSEWLSLAVILNRPYQVYFDIGGASVVGGALRLCRAATGNRIVVGFSGAFHGTSYLAATVTDPRLLDKRQYGLGDFDGDVVRLPFPDRLGSVSSADCLGLLDGVLAQEDVAAVIVEPIQGAAGFIQPHNDFLPGLRERTAASQVPLIVDEIQMGVGRAGALYSFSRHGIEPDVVTLSKSLAGGMFPLSALIADPYRVSEHVQQ
jgi:4-aminobutyrate aminotransferase/(S)-3-amino-2-methylpropionate transaminase